MELMVKSGCLLVEVFPEGQSPIDLAPHMYAGTISSGAIEIGMIVFFNRSMPFIFDQNKHIVKMEDVVAWIKPEEPKSQEVGA